MADITLQLASTDGAELDLTRAAAASDTMVNNGNTVLIVVNGSGADNDITITSQVATAHPGEAVADLVVTVPNGETHVIGPFNQAAYNNADGKIEIAYESTTSTEVAALKIDN